MKMVPRNNKGFSLIEVMSALVIFTTVSIGALSLNGQSIKDSRISLYHFQADSLVSQMVDRIRMNANEDTKAIYEVSGEEIISDGESDGPIGQSEKDIHEWTSEVIQSLPGASYNISWDGQVVSVTLVWSDEGAKFKRTDLCGVELQKNKTCLTVNARVCSFEEDSGDFECTS